jgi:NTE family protein
VKLWRKGKAHFIVDGGLLSNFPVWLFDAQGRPPARPTWGFRLHGGVAPDEQPAYRQIPMPLWRVKLLHAMFEAATGAWDVRQLGATTGARSVSIPTGKISTLDFGLTPTDAEALFERGRSRARSFFESDDVRKYLEEFAARQEQPAHA